MFRFVSVFEATALLKKEARYTAKLRYIGFFTLFQSTYFQCVLLFPLSLKCPAALERGSFQNRSQSQKEHIHCFLVLLILFPLEDTRCFHRTESECHEYCCTHTQEPVCHGIVSGLRQVDFCVGRICTGAGLRVNGVNVQHIAVFVGQRDLASFL